MSLNGISKRISNDFYEVCADSILRVCFLFLTTDSILRVLYLQKEKKRKIQLSRALFPHVDRVFVQDWWTEILLQRYTENPHVYVARVLTFENYMV